MAITRRTRAGSIRRPRRTRYRRRRSPSSLEHWVTTSPYYRGERPIAPPTFAAMIASPAWQLMFDDPELELALRRIVHGDQRFDYTRPLLAGDVVSATLTIDKVRVRGGSEIISASVAITDLSGETVCTVDGDFRPLRGRVRHDTSRPSGDALPPLTVHLTREQLVRYAGASGDFNPIHYSDHWARRARAGRRGRARHADHGRRAAGGHRLDRRPGRGPQLHCTVHPAGAGARRRDRRRGHLRSLGDLGRWFGSDVGY